MSADLELTSLTGPASAPPGGELALRFGVANRGPLADRIQFRVLAVPPDAARISPAELSLAPGESGVVEVRIRLPAQAPAGSFPAALRAVSANAPAKVSDLPFDIVVAAQPASTAGPAPPALGAPPTPQVQGAHPSPTRPVETSPPLATTEPAPKPRLPKSYGTPPAAQPPPRRSRLGCEDRLLRMFILLLVLLLCACITAFGLVRPDMSGITRLLTRTSPYECGGNRATVVTPQPMVVNVTTTSATLTAPAATSTRAPQPTSAAISAASVALLPAGGFLELPFPYDGGNENFGGTDEQFRRASNRSALGGRINSYFDHLYPLYPAAVNGARVGGREPRDAPAGGAVLTFSGILGTGTSYGYSGHPGFDYSVFEWRKATTPLFAAADGFLTAVGVDAYGGHYIKIVHPVQDVGNFQTMYLHLEPDEYYNATKRLYTEQPGRPIRAGTRIGTMGNTGLSSGHHLHFEVWFDRDHNGVFEGDERVDPYGFIPSPEFPEDPWGTVQSFTDGRGNLYRHQPSPSRYLWKHPLGVVATIPEGGGSVPLLGEGQGGAPESDGEACVSDHAVPAGSTVVFAWAPDDPPTNGLAGTGNGCVLIALDPSGRPLTAFAQSIPIILAYSDEQVQDVALDSLSIYFQASSGDWQKLPTQIDQSLRRARAEMPQPGRCALLGDPAGDIVAPHTTVRLNGQPAAPTVDAGAPGTQVFGGPVTVSLAADDGPDGSGVDFIEYSTDGGLTWTRYQQPFVVQPKAVPEALPDTDALESLESFGARPGEFAVLATAHDKAGNIEEPPAMAGFIIRLDLTGLWEEQGRRVREVQITQTGASVEALFVEPYVCDHRDGTGRTSSTNFDFRGTLDGSRLAGEITVCFFGEKHANDAGLHLTSLELELSPDGNTLSGAWLNPDTGASVPITLIRKH